MPMSMSHLLNTRRGDEMVYTLRSDEKFEITLCENDTVKSVLQNLAVLLATRKGTIPMYREFGLNMGYIDKPIDVATALMTSEIAEAIEDYEPRATLLNLEIENSIEEPGKVAVVLEVDISV